MVYAIPRPPDAHVPCNGCKACCHHVLITLLPEHGDVVESYKHFECINPLTGEPGFALVQNPDGSCVYLGANGCTIHGHAPAICKTFDCRGYYLRFTDRAARRRAVRMGIANPSILAAGRARLSSLEGNPS